MKRSVLVVQSLSHEVIHVGLEWSNFSAVYVDGRAVVAFRLRNIESSLD